MRRIFCIFIILSATIGIAQEPFNLRFKHITIQDGLSNPNVMAMLPDSRGYLWLGTLSGLDRYDGNKIKNYNTSIANAEITNMLEAPNGDIFVGTVKGLCRYIRKTDQFVKFNQNDQRNAWLLPVGNNQRFYYQIGDSLIGYDTQKHKIFEKYHFKSALNGLAAYYKTKNEIRFFAHGSNENGIHLYQIKSGKLTLLKTFFDGKNKQPLYRSIAPYTSVQNDSIAWIGGGIGGGLIKLNLNNSKFKIIDPKAFPKELHTRSVMVGNYLITGGFNGIYVFDIKNERFVQYFHHSNLKTTSLNANWIEYLALDNKNNIYISSLGVGIDVASLKSENLSTLFDVEVSNKLAIPSSHVSYMHNSKDILAISPQYGNSVLMDLSGKQLAPISDFLVIAINNDNDIFWRFGNEYRLSHGAIGTKEKILGMPKGLNWAVLGIADKDGNFLIGTDKGIFELAKGSHIVKETGLTTKGGFLVAEPYYLQKADLLSFRNDSRRELYLCKKIDNKWRQVHFLNNIGRIYAVKDCIEPNRIWICCVSGLLKLDTKTNKIVETFTSRQGLPENNIIDILEYSNGDHWLVGGHGVYFYKAATKKYRKMRPEEGFDAYEYLWGGATFLPDSTVIFPSTSGVIRSHRKLISNNQLYPSLVLNQLFINEKPVKNININEHDFLQLRPSQNTLALELAAINSGSSTPIHLQYDLENYDALPVIVPNFSTIRFVNLPSGDHSLTIKAIDETNGKVLAVRLLHFNIAYSLMQHPATKIVLLALLGGLSYLLVRYRKQQIINETSRIEEIKRVRAEAELNALRSQMNPHFVFNSLNTIDAYILQNKTRQASEFLGRFSKLIRRVLENSRSEYIPLRDELSTLELYIQMEQERSSHGFDYQINNNTNRELFLPALLMQPLVENAILHGLRHLKNEKGQLTINLDLLANRLLIKIIDNGIGRQKAAELSGQSMLGKSSLAGQIIEQRLEQLRAKSGQDASLKYEDNIPHGTIATIVIPVLFNDPIQLNQS